MPQRPRLPPPNTTGAGAVLRNDIVPINDPATQRKADVRTAKMRSLQNESPGFFERAATGMAGIPSGIGDYMSGLGDDYMGQNDYRSGSPGLDATNIDADRAHGSRIRAQQGGFTTHMDGVMRGEGPSVAAQQMRAGQDAAIAAARSQAASARGGNMALANRGSALGQASALQQTNRDAGMLRAQEMLNAQQLMSQHLQNQRMADLQAQGLSLEQAQAVLDSQMKAQEINAGITEGTAGRRAEAAGGIMSGIGNAFSSILSSDARAKTDIRPMYSDIISKTDIKQPDMSALDSAHDRQYGDPANKLAAGVFGPGAAGSPAPTQTAETTHDGPAPWLTQYRQDNPADFGDALSKTVAVKPDPNVRNLDSPSEEKPLDVSLPGRDKQAKKIEELEKEVDKPKGNESSYDYGKGAGGLASLATMALMFSDENTKTEITRLETERDAALDMMKSFGRGQATQAPTGRYPDTAALDAAKSRQDLGPVQPYQFRYKPEFAARGNTDTEPRVGVMAQDLQKSPAYQASVVETPDGTLALDKDRLLQANTAQVGGLDKRLANIESALGQGQPQDSPGSDDFSSVLARAKQGNFYGL